MILIHDLVEIRYQDNPAHKKQPADKSAQEYKALVGLIKNLPARSRKNFKDLWEEYETAKTPEALFARNIDKTEVLLQHNEANIKYLHPKEIPLYFYYGKEFSLHDKFLVTVREMIEKESLDHFKKSKIDKRLYEKYL